MDFIDKNALYLWRAVLVFKKKQQSFPDLILSKQKFVQAGRFFSRKEAGAAAAGTSGRDLVCAFAEATL
ncbi:MAG: hypothetical protein ACQETG_00175 [Thermodesulfobacteriota bacterium]